MHVLSWQTLIVFPLFSYSQYRTIGERTSCQFVAILWTMFFFNSFPSTSKTRRQFEACLLWSNTFSAGWRGSSRCNILTSVRFLYCLCQYLHLEGEGHEDWMNGLLCGLKWARLLGFDEYCDEWINAMDEHWGPYCSIALPRLWRFNIHRHFYGKIESVKDNIKLVLSLSLTFSCRKKMSGQTLTNPQLTWLCTVGYCILAKKLELIRSKYDLQQWFCDVWLFFSVSK